MGATLIWASLPDFVLLLNKTKRLVASTNYNFILPSESPQLVKI